jgi:hypothetical protein
MAALPTWGEDWLRTGARELWTHLHRDHRHIARSASSVASLLQGHYAAHRAEGSDPHPFFPGEPTPAPSQASVVRALQAVGVIGPERTRRQLEDGFTRLNPDFGVIPERHDPLQHDLAYRREQAMTLGLRVLVALRDENAGAHARRIDVIGQRGREAFDPTAGGPPFRSRTASQREVDP